MEQVHSLVNFEAEMVETSSGEERENFEQEESTGGTFRVHFVEH